VLLTRKFEERFLCPPSQYKLPVLEKTLARRSARVQALRTAQDKYIPLECNPSDDTTTYPFQFGKDRNIAPGTIFEIETTEWAMIGIDREGYNAKVIAVPVVDVVFNNAPISLSLSTLLGGVPELRGMPYEEVIDAIGLSILVDANDLIE